MPSFKGQFTMSRRLRDALGWGQVQGASIDPQGRLVLVLAKDEPEHLFRDRPAVRRTLSLDDMERAIAAAVGREDA